MPMSILARNKKTEKETNKNSGDDGRLFQRVLLGKCVGNKNFTSAVVIDNIVVTKLDRRTTKEVKVALNDLDCFRNRGGHSREIDILRSLRQNNVDDNLIVRDIFRTLQQGKLQQISVLTNDSAEKLKVNIPANGEVVVPATKDGVSRSQLQERASALLSKITGADVANEISIVRFSGIRRELDINVSCSSDVKVVRVGATGIVKSRKAVVLQLGTGVVHLVEFFERSSATPV